MKPTETRQLMLVSATYENQDKRVVLKFYDPVSHKLVSWKDNMGHKPYCYSKLSADDLHDIKCMDRVAGISRVPLRDMTQDEHVCMSKITVADPFALNGTHGKPGVKNMIETWEADIRYHESYLYDRNLVVGRHYRIEDGDIVPHSMEMPNEVQSALKTLLWDKADDTGMTDAGEFQECVTAWADLLNQPIPDIRRLAVYIKVEASDRLPDPAVANRKITAVGLKGSILTRCSCSKPKACPRVKTALQTGSVRLYRTTSVTSHNTKFLLFCSLF